MTDTLQLLKLLLKQMDVPERELTTENLKWLGANLASTHEKHPDFPEAIHLVANLLTIQGESTKDIAGRG